MRRRFKAVTDVLGAMIRYGVSLARSVELTIQWERILAGGPLYLVTLNDFICSSRFWGLVIFIKWFLMVYRRGEAIREDFVSSLLVAPA